MLCIFHTISSRCEHPGCAAVALMGGEAVAGRLTGACQNERKDRREALERSLTKDEERTRVL